MDMLGHERVGEKQKLLALASRFELFTEPSPTQIVLQERPTLKARKRQLVNRPLFLKVLDAFSVALVHQHKQ
jgi:hypothetical protein